MEKRKTKLPKLKRGNIMIIDDCPASLALLEEFTASEGYAVQAFISGKKAMAELKENKTDIILLDAVMPEIDGFELCKKIKQDENLKSIPIIFISGLGSLENKIKAFSLGCADYIVKPFEKMEVLARINTQLTVRNLQNELENRNLILKKQIAEHMRSAKALKEIRENLESLVEERTKSLEIYRKIVSASRDHLSFINRDYQYRAVNRSLERYYNKSAAEIVGRTPIELHGKDKFKNIIKENLDSCFSGNQVQDQYRKEIKGSTRYYDVVMFPYYEKDSTISGCVVNTRDMTKQKKYEDRINLAYSQLDQIFNSVGDGMYIIDNEFNLIQANKAFLKMINTQKDLILGKKCYEFFTYDACGSSKCPLKKIMAGAERVENNHSIEIRKGSKTFLSLTAAPFRDNFNKINGIVVNVKDITEKIKAEEKEKIRKEKMVQTEKLASIGILAAGIAHEINNPNGVIMLNIPMLTRCWNNAGPIFEEYYKANGDFKLGSAPWTKLKKRIPYLLEQTLESSKRIKTIVSELKDFARQELVEMTEVDINEVIRTSISLALNKIKKSTSRFQVEYEKQPLYAKGSFQRLEQVFINVLINSCESLLHNDRGIFVKTMADNDNGNVVVLIRDQGKGIKKEDVSCLFTPFYTTKRDTGGTGLGLSVSHGIISEHGGSIKYESMPGKGTTCYISLPMIR